MDELLHNDKHMNELLRKHGVELYSTENEEQSCAVERWNRTIMRIIWEYFTANNTTNYIDVLPSLIEKYNNTYHRSIKCTPSFAENHQTINMSKMLCIIT